MLLSKESLFVYEAGSTDDPRYSLSGVRVEPDGSCVATDGKILARYTPRMTGILAEDYPGVQATGGVNACDGPELEPFVLPTDACKAIIKAVPKGRRCSLPILGYIALDTEQTNQNGEAVLGVTDLENPQVFRPRKPDGTFPRYQNVIPKDTDRGESVLLGVGLLERLVRMAKKQGFEQVRVTLNKKPADCPVLLEAENDDGKLTALVMPMHDGR